MLLFVRFITLVLGFFGALSFVRSDSPAFNWYASQVYGDWFNWEQWRSILWLVGCLVLFAYSIWATKPEKIDWLHRKLDYSVLVLLVVVGFAAAALTIRLNPSNFNLFFFPISSYTLVMLVFGEFWARLRDKTLLSTLYWISFFKAYPIWKPIGFFALLLLASQLVLLIHFFPTIIRLFALFTICTLTYFAAFLVSIGKSYDRANEEKIRAERFKSELITNVSHDIKTPLTSIINYVDLLKNTEMQGKPAEYVQVLDKKSARLKSLIDDLMEASKAGTGNISIEMQNINLGEIVGQAAGEFEEIFSEKNLTLVLRQSGETMFIQSDSRHLYRALENLFSNCAKYALSGTRVFAEITRENGVTKLTLQNTSANPIDLYGERINELTEQFIRGDKSRQTEGNGLGLYIAKSLVELMGGKLQVTIIGDLFRVEVISTAHPSKTPQ